MEYVTKLFGKIDVDDSKVITFPEGLLGFPDMKRFALIFDSDNSDAKGLNFLASLDEPAFMMPVVPAVAVKPDYSPQISAEVEKSIGELT